MIEGAIRPLVLCLIKYQDNILVMDGYDPKKDQVFYRILGGGIDFGELGEQALKREFKEELDAELENVKYLTTLENIFTFDGKKGHEIIVVFTADLKDKDFYQKDNFPIKDSKANHKASWQKIADFKDQNLILYPIGILDFI